MQTLPRAALEQSVLGEPSAAVPQATRAKAAKVVMLKLIIPGKIWGNQ